MSEIRFYRAVGEYGFLSNLYKMESGFWLPDEYLPDQDEVFRKSRHFVTAEQAYQYGKPLTQEVADWIVFAPKPHLSAIAAHGLFVYDIEPTWQKRKVDRMRWVLMFKFARTSQWTLANKLLHTGDAKLVEESNTDAFWGIGKKGDGKNMLGVLLMERRENLRRELEEHRRQISK